MQPFETSRSAVRQALGLIASHERLKSLSISLLPAENILSPLATRALSSDLVNRYLLVDNTIWEYPQIDHMLKLQELCISQLKGLFGTAFVNVRPLSGLNCMTVLLAALTEPGDSILSMDPDLGGHGATAVVASRLGLNVNYLPFDPIYLDFDVEATIHLAERLRTRLIYIDIANFLFPPSLALLRTKLPAEVFIHFDCSHIMGLLLDPTYFNPLACGLSVIAGSTHKTFPGPQKGIIATNDNELAAQFERTTNTFISSHHMNSVAALCIAAIEMSVFGQSYAHQVLSNARTLAQALRDEGLPVQGKPDGALTASHQVWMAAPQQYSDASEAVAELKNAQLIVNCARIPTIRGKGLRLGSTEVTRLGMKEDEMREIASAIAAVLLRRIPRDTAARRVRDIRAAFPGPKYCFDVEDA